MRCGHTLISTARRRGKRLKNMSIIAWDLKRNASLLALSLLLVSCGGDDQDTDRDNDDLSVTNNNPNSPTTVDANLYITDDFSTDYDAVWLTVNKIAFFNGASETVALNAEASPYTINVTQLKRSGLFIEKISVPSDATHIRIYVDDNARLITPEGGAINASISREVGGFISVPLSGYNRNSGSLIVDFDLPSFSLSGTTLTAPIVLASEQDANTWSTRDGEIEGTVRSVSNNSISVETRSGRTYTIALNSYTTYKGATVGWTPSVGSFVEVDVVISGTLSAPNFEALSVSAEDLSDRSDNQGTPEIEGRIIAINGDRISVSVYESEDIRLSGTIVVAVGQATFTRGNTASLAVGQVIDAYIAPTPNTDGSWQARVIEIEGAAKSGSIGDSDDGGEVYSEIEGRVISLSGAQALLEIFKIEGVGGISVGERRSFDLTGVVFKEGSLQCLGAGSNLELKGYTDTSGSFVITIAEVDGGCAGSDDDSSDDPNGNSEVEGLITSVGANSFVVNVLKVDDWFGAVPQSLTITYDNNTYFEDLRSSDLRNGLLVEAEGPVANGIMAARKIERE